MKKLSKDEFQDEVVNCVQPAVVDFGAEWCGPCKKLKPILEDLSGQYSGTVKFFEVDVGEDPGIAQQFGVMSLPTILIFKDGKVTETFTGLVAKNKIEDKLKDLI